MMTIPVKKPDLERGLTCACGHHVPATTDYRTRCARCQQVYVVKGK